MTSGAERRVFVKTYGCQMNVYDGERIADVLALLGYAAADLPEAADLIVLNTCHIREKAAEKVYSDLGKLRRLKNVRARKGLQTTIAVAGCVAQAEGQEIIRRAPVVDLVFGPQAYHRLPAMLERLADSGRPVVEAEFRAEDKFDQLGPSIRARIAARGVTAFLTVQEGCDKFCTFCVVPYTRGAEFSRPVIQIVAEAERLADAGVREVTLLGQNVNAYRGKGPGGNWSLARLLTRLSQIEGIGRLRYMTSHPRDMDDDLIAAHGQNGKLMPYLHLPVQAGSDRILKAMNRGHKADDYARLIERIRRARPDIAIAGDFIVGFPGESEKDFEETLTLVRHIRYASAFSFKYSPRPGTPAAESEHQVPDAIKSERLIRLQALLDEQRQSFNASCVGRRMSILLEKPGRHPLQIAGRSPYLQPVHLDAVGLSIGDLVEVEIEAVSANSLSAVKVQVPTDSGRKQAAMEGALGL